jgi:hypothetical protein
VFAKRGELTLITAFVKMFAQDRGGKVVNTDVLWNRLSGEDPALHCRQKRRYALIEHDFGVHLKSAIAAALRARADELLAGLPEDRTTDVQTFEISQPNCV